MGKPSVISVALVALCAALASLPSRAAGPAPESLLKAKSLQRILDDYDVITNSEWSGAGDADFGFVNAALIRTPLGFAQPLITDYSLYAKMSSAIKKFEYDPATKIIELEGEAGGMRMHSWLRVEQRPGDGNELVYEIIRGDLVGLKVHAYLWDRNGKTLAIARGSLPRARAMLPALVRLVFKPVSEVVIGVATRNFRSYIEEEYRKRKTAAK